MFFDELSPKETNIQITKEWAKNIVPDGGVLMTGPAKTVYEGKAILPE